MILATHSCDSSTMSGNNLETSTIASFKTVVSLIVALLTLVLNACTEAKLSDVSQSAEYSGLVGTRYMVGEGIMAYAICDYDLPGRPIRYIKLMPNPGISGPEVAYRIPVPPGSIFTVTGVFKVRYFLENPLMLVGSLPGVKVPESKEVQLEFRLGNEGIGNQPNVSYYRKM